MNTTTFLRVAVGLLFMVSGFAKTKRFGKKLIPDVWHRMQKEFKRMDQALKDFPYRDTVKIGPAEAQELFGYIDMICGFLLLTGNLLYLALLVLIIELSGLEYTLFIMKSPALHQGFVIGLLIALVSILVGRESKEKTD